MSVEKLIHHREIWKKKAVLRKIYKDWYQMILANLAPGKVVEIGGGSGNFKESCPRALSGDIVPTPWIDLVLDAHHLPFKNNSVQNLVLFDVLHHLENPFLFLKESERVLITKGRLILMEPYISIFSYPIYHFLHPELVAMKIDPFVISEKDPKRTPFDSNQAIPKLIFEKYIERFKKNFPHFDIILIKRCAIITYLLSGGFEKPSLIPEASYPFFRWLEEKLRFLSRFMAFRLFVVLEKNR